MAHLGRNIIASLLYWIPLATLTVLVSGMVYLAVQQSERSAANDPQIQMATDARDALMNGASPRSLIPADTRDIAQSLAPYLAIYDANGQVVAASATLHGQPLAPPPGVFASARVMDMDLVTWMPERGVRSAIVVIHYADGYVLAGRSLALAEQREGNLEFEVGAACAATLVLTYLAVLLTRILAPRLAAAPASGES